MGYRPRRDVSDAQVRVVVGDHSVVACVRSVSAGGLQIRDVFDADIGDPVAIELREKTFPCKIVWQTETDTGVAFDTALSAVDLTLFTGRAHRSHGVARTRVGFSGHNALRR